MLIGPPTALLAEPTSRAFRPFIASNLKVAFGVNRRTALKNRAQRCFPTLVRETKVSIEIAISPAAHDAVETTLVSDRTPYALCFLIDFAALFS
jgi:hypothetical protein